ncbi:serine--tRNA ligase [Candidatus Bipolaricaulota bacterium]|nr:serine--tRNA ligase [Candidatus Bipolaricaulota bacterium]
MLDIHALREDPAGIEKRLQTRDPSIELSGILALDEKRRSLITLVEERKAERNRGSADVGHLKKQGGDADALLARLQMLSDEISALDNELRAVTEDLQGELQRLPNIPHPTVPVGEKEDKVILKTHGEKPEPEFEVRSHVAIGERLGLFDFERAARIAGSRFPMYTGRGALLEMALVSWMVRHHAQRDYTPIWPPFVANEESFYVSSQLPKFADEIYYVEKDRLYLNPTAESLLVNLHRDEILAAADLPRKYVAYTPCFRREAGSYGEEERGLIRVHQFNKVELFKFCAPERSYDELGTLIEDAESVLMALGLHYRVALLSTKDMAQQASKTVDLEVYLPTQGRYYEVSSCSNCETFQSRRGAIRYRPVDNGKPEFLHTLNGSGLATPRLVAAILENNQTEDGRVWVPEVLQDAVGVEWL